MQQEYSTNIHEHALQGYANGMKICANAVKGTIGKGRNVIIQQKMYPGYLLTKDAYSIIQSVKLGDPIENQAVLMLKDAMDSQNKKSKDGRTAMTLMTDAILQESIASGQNPMQIKDEIEALYPIIAKEIDAQTVQITVDEVEKVARTASDSDRIGKLISEIYKEIGKDGIIDLEGSGTWDDNVTYIDGIRFADATLLSPMLVHDEQAIKEGRTETKAVYENPTILVTKKKISKLDDINPLLLTLENLEEPIKDLVIFTDDMDSTVASYLIATHKNKRFNICIIKAPVLWKGLVFEDFAKVTGSTIIDDSMGTSFKRMPLAVLGTCGKIVVDKEETLITGIADVSEHITELKKINDNDSQRRLAWLNTKSAILRLGANNEGELSLLRLKAEDAIHSSNLALHYGVVAGGGTALFNISKKMQNPIMKKVLSTPFQQIVENSFGNVGEIEQQIKTKTQGFNAKTGKVEDMYEAGILDSAVVVKNSLRNAIALASIPLSGSIYISIPPQTVEELMSGQKASQFAF